MPRRRATDDELPDIIFDESVCNSLVLQRKIQYILKPIPVKTYLAKTHFNLLKKCNEKIECSICLTSICCENCVTLLSCGHLFHAVCYNDCMSYKCPTCNQ